jgi:hypothetical protein
MKAHSLPESFSPAIPINLIKGIGVDVVQGYIDLLPSRS